MLASPTSTQAYSAHCVGLGHPASLSTAFTLRCSRPPFGRSRQVPQSDSQQTGGLILCRLRFITLWCVRSFCVVVTQLLVAVAKGPSICAIRALNLIKSSSFRSYQHGIHRNHVPNYAERPFDLLWCAQINDKVKNVSFFLKVAIALNSKVRGLRVRLVGRGKAEQEAIARLTAAGIEYQHDAHIDWSKMANVFVSAKLLLLPSLWEPWGLVCNEAMQCGAVPIVSPFVGAGDDLVISGKTGHVCPLQVQEWVRTIEQLLRNEQEWIRLSHSACVESKRRNVKSSASLFEHFIELVDPQ